MLLAMTKIAEDGSDNKKLLLGAWIIFMIFFYFVIPKLFGGQAYCERTLTEGSNGVNIINAVVILKDHSKSKYCLYRIRIGSATELESTDESNCSGDFANLQSIAIAKNAVVDDQYDRCVTEYNTVRSMSAANWWSNFFTKANPN